MTTVAPARPAAPDGDVSVASLVERFGSPLYVYDLDRLRAAAADLHEALPAGVGVYYSLKANPHPVVVEALRAAPTPCRAEVCSPGELRSALDGGHDPAQLLYGGPGKTPAELALAVRAGVRQMSVESAGDLQRVGDAAHDVGVVVDCLLRVNASDASSPTSIRMTGVPSQFGFDSEVLPALLPALHAVAGTRIVGLHLYPLSNAADEASLLDAFAVSVTTAARLAAATGLDIEVLDLGGGFAAPYAADARRETYPALADHLAGLLDDHFPGWRAGAPAVWCESGRYLAGDCGTLVTRVTDVKVSRGTTFVVLDAGVNVFGGMAGLGRMLPARIGLDGAEPVGTATLVGPLCTPGDVLARNLAVPDLHPGDLVRIPAAGAYGATASLIGFLGRPAAAEVFLSHGEVVAATRLELSRQDLVSAPPSTDTAGGRA